MGKKVEKLEKIALGAAEQSKRNLVPSITLLRKGRLSSQLDQFDSIVVAYEESAKEGEAAALLQSLTGIEAGSKLLFIFGPEGGLSPAEIESFAAKGAVPCRTWTSDFTSRNSPTLCSQRCGVLLQN